MGRSVFGYNEAIFLAMNEDEGTGLVNTRRSKINAIIKELKTNSVNNPDAIALKYGIDPRSITQEEEDYINRKVGE